MEDSIAYLQMAKEWLIATGPNIVSALVILVGGRWLVRRTTGRIGKALTRSGMDDTLVRFLDRLIYYTLLIAVILAAADQIGIKTTSFLAILGAAGLAVGLALKDSLANFASGVMLILFKPFRVRDAVGEAKDILRGLVEADNRILDDPPPRIALAEFGDSSINLVARPWVKTADYWDVRFGLMDNIKKSFDELNITIPYPQRDVHVYQHQAGQ